MELVERQIYSRKLIEYKDKQIIKVITGVRRCGKSTLLKQHRDFLKKQGITDDGIIFINFEDYEYNELRNPDKLYAYIQERLVQNEMNYIFLDEVQQVADFRRVVNSLYIKDNVDLYITGSNAHLYAGFLCVNIFSKY